MNVNDFWARLRGEPKHESHGLALFLGGLGLGAALVYFLDPAGGTARRAMVRERAVTAARQTRQTLEKTTQELVTRARETVTAVQDRLGEAKAQIPGAVPTPPALKS